MSKILDSRTCDIYKKLINFNNTDKVDPRCIILRAFEDATIISTPQSEFQKKEANRFLNNVENLEIYLVNIELDASYECLDLNVENKKEFESDASNEIVDATLIKTKYKHLH